VDKWIKIEDPMEETINGATLRLTEGDITRESTDVIVNAANSSLRGGGGVDGAIHRVGGPQILKECSALGGCATGEACVTSGGNLKARYVIHTVGPVWQGGDKDEENLLACCYRNSLMRAVEKNANTISFPSISTGAYGYPLELAAPVAIATIRDFLAHHREIKEVHMVLFDSRSYDAYARALKNPIKERNE
jgi:O-acetyl-ADP-ribose deacetylase